jgi:hypothetical protein
MKHTPNQPIGKILQDWWHKGYNAALANLTSQETIEWCKKHKSRKQSHFGFCDWGCYLRSVDGDTSLSTDDGFIDPECEVVEAVLYAVKGDTE